MKIQSIQILRGFAAWIVVYHHFMQIFFAFKPTNAVGDFFSQYGVWGVDIFFVISGFIMAYILLSSTREHSLRGFLSNRLIRVWPNYIIWTILTLIIAKSFLPEMDASYADMKSLLKSLLFIPHENPSPILDYYPTLSVGWTLNYEMLFYCVISLSLLFKANIKIKLVAVMLIFAILPHIALKTGVLSMCGGFLTNSRLNEFSIGIAIALVYTTFSTRINWLFFILLFAFVGALQISVDKPLHLIFILQNIFFRPCISALIVYICLLNNNLFSKQMFRPFQILGEMSYSTYLCHVMILWCTMHLVTQVSRSTTTSTTVALLVYSLIVLLLSYLSFWLIETKITRLLKSKLR